jgi:uncharacterized protein
MVCLLWLAVLAACSCNRSSESPNITRTSTTAPSGEVRVHVTSVGFDRATGAHYVLLHDDGQARELPIMIGDTEAQAILLALHNVKPDRPLTQDLLRSVIEETGNRLDRILISEMRDEVFYAKIYLDKGKVTIDSRPSDAIALAMASKVPIYVNSSLFEDTSNGDMIPSGKVPKTQRALGMTVEQITPELAEYFGGSGAGVLVSEVDESAKKAGVARGDIVMRVGNHLVQGLDKFGEEVAAAKGQDTLRLTILRDGTARTVTIGNRSAEN